MSDTSFPTLRSVASIIDQYASSYEDGIPNVVTLYISRETAINIFNEINTVLRNEEGKDNE